MQEGHYFYLYIQIIFQTRLNKSVSKTVSCDNKVNGLPFQWLVYQSEFPPPLLQ